MPSHVHEGGGAVVAHDDGLALVDRGGQGDVQKVIGELLHDARYRAFDAVGGDREGRDRRGRQRPCAGREVVLPLEHDGRPNRLHRGRGERGAIAGHGHGVGLLRRPVRRRHLHLDGVRAHRRVHLMAFVDGQRACVGVLQRHVVPIEIGHRRAGMVRGRHERDLLLGERHRHAVHLDSGIERRGQVDSLQRSRGQVPTLKISSLRVASSDSSVESLSTAGTPPLPVVKSATSLPAASSRAVGAGGGLVVADDDGLVLQDPGRQVDLQAAAAVRREARNRHRVAGGGDREGILERRRDGRRKIEVLVESKFDGNAGRRHRRAGELGRAEVQLGVVDDRRNPVPAGGEVGDLVAVGVPRASVPASDWS